MSKIKLHIQTSEGQNFPVVIDVNDTLDFLKGRIRDKTGYDVSSQKLFYDGDELCNNYSYPLKFEYHDHWHGKILKLLVGDRYFQTNRSLLLRSKSSIQVVIHIAGSERKIYVDIEKHDSVRFLKEKIRSQVCCSVKDQSLRFGGLNQNRTAELEDHLSIKECGIGRGTTLSLRINDPDLQISDPEPQCSII